jgi:hypothetical protein
MLGWKDRSFAVPAEHAKRVHPGGGIVRPVALVDACAAGTWTARSRGGDVRVELDPFGPLEPDAERALTREAAAVERFLSAPG